MARKVYSKDPSITEQVAGWIRERSDFVLLFALVGIFMFLLVFAVAVMAG